MKIPESNFLKSLLAILLSLAIFSVQAASNRDIKKDYPVSKLSDRIYVIYGPVGEPTKANQGFRNNAIFVVTKKGVVVMDPGTSVYVGNMILKKIKTVTNKSVVAVFNSHAHGDHWLGNQAFKDANPKVNIYAHANMIKQAKEGEGDRWIKLFNGATDNAVVGTKPVIPNKSVKDGDVIKIGELSFRIHHTGSAHTDGDIMVEVVEEKAILTGDIVRVGLVGISNKSFKGNIKAIDRALKTKAKLFVPGHGKANDQRVAKNYRKFMSILRNTVAKHYESGLSDFEIKPKVVKGLSKYKNWSRFKENIGRLVSLTYLEVEAEAFQ
jgi:glyoxylase-like metal-dependent hydrolase (beta-lactamase superfamily II)